MGLIKKCEHCDNLIPKEGNRSWPQYAKKRFCSRECNAASQTRKLRCSCNNCEAEFDRSPSHKGDGLQFCSIECRKLYHGVEKPCDHCGEITRKPRSNAMGGRFFCSAKCAGLARRKQGGQTKGRRSPGDLAWRREVLEACGFRCAICNTDRRLEAHHIKPVKDFPELRYDTSNGLCVCHQCHYYGIHGGKPNFIHGRYSKK